MIKPYHNVLGISRDEINKIFPILLEPFLLTVTVVCYFSWSSKKNQEKRVILVCCVDNDVPVMTVSG